MHPSRSIVVVLFACLPLGCVTQPSSPVDSLQSITVSAQESGSIPRLIAVDFVNVLRQLELLEPAATTINLLRESRSDEFTMAMQEALQTAGYGVRWVNDLSSGQLFQYRLEQVDADDSAQQSTYEMAVGSVELRRSYLMEGPVISPVTPLYIRGADGSGVVLNDTQFTQLAAAAAEKSDKQAVKPSASASAPIVIPVPTPAVAEKIPSQEPRVATAPLPAPASRLAVPDEANPLNPVVSGVSAKQQLSLPMTTLTRVENVFDLGESNFEDLLSEHRVVQELILLFPNDSLRLGAVNKRLVDEMVRSFQPDSDLFSVIGCSLGPTTLESGNAALALGRASRVREALLFAGIPQNRILDEGCWAGDSLDNTLPRRGVVVTLNRQE